MYALINVIILASEIAIATKNDNINNNKNQIFSVMIEIMIEVNTRTCNANLAVIKINEANNIEIKKNE